MAHGILPNLVVIPKGYQTLNQSGMELANLAAWHYQRIGNSGILAAPPEPGSNSILGSAANPIAAKRTVWLDEPSGAVPFDEQGTVFIPLAPNVDTTITAFTVPQGFDGVIKWISNTASDPFPPGTFIWKILINGRPSRNFGNITVEKGSIQQGRVISPIRIFSGDMVAYTIRTIIPANVTPDETTTASFTGYFYPSKGIS